MEKILVWLIAAAAIAEQEKLGRQLAFGLSILTHDLHDEGVRSFRKDMQDGTIQLMIAYDQIIERAMSEYDFPECVDHSTVTVFGMNFSPSPAASILFHEEANERAEQLQSIH